MAFHNDDFCRGIAMVLQGESKRAATYVTHAASLGTLREKMVGNFVRHETPERFRVETGLIRNHARNLTSRQCDLLVHEPWATAPLYRYEDFVIVDDSAARAVVEVKSDLDKDNFEGFLDIHASVMKLELMSGGRVRVPTFGYGLTGATMPYLANYLRDALGQNRLRAEGIEAAPTLNWPFCLAVQSRNIIGLRPQMGVPGEKKDYPYCFCLADLTKATDATALPVDGIETGFFLHFYSLMIRNQRDNLTTVGVYNWFNNLPLSPDGKLWIAPDGTITQGDIPYK